MSQQFQRVNNKKENENIKPNEIRITSQGRPRNYISYVVGLFEPTEQQQTTYDTVMFKAMRKAINKAVSIVEIVKRRVKGLYQITEIHSTPITDEFVPTEEGLNKVVTKKTVSSITITLSKKPLDTKNIGYQDPLPDSEVEEDIKRKEESDKQRAATKSTKPIDGDETGAKEPRPQRGGAGRGGRGGRGRGGRGRGRGNMSNDGPVHDGAPYNSENTGRGRGRGGYNNNNSSRYAADDAVHDGPQEGGFPETRGRGRGRGGRGGRGSDRGDRGGRGRGGRGSRGGDRGDRGGRGGRGGRGRGNSSPVQSDSI